VKTSEYNHIGVRGSKIAKETSIYLNIP